jgi:hypothetical protein
VSVYFFVFPFLSLPLGWDFLFLKFRAWDEGVAQAVERLPGKCKPLSSTPVLKKKTNHCCSIILHLRDHGYNNCFKFLSTTTSESSQGCPLLTFSPFFPLPSALGIGLRASHLLSKYSTMWAMAPNSFDL